MASSSENNTTTAATDTSSRESMELIFFNMFSDNFMRGIGPTRMVLEQRHPAMLSEIIENLHKVSAYAADMSSAPGPDIQRFSPGGAGCFCRRIFAAD